MDIKTELQRKMVEEYRRTHPEAAMYSDEEIAQMEPITPVEVNLYISELIKDLQDELNYNLSLITDPKTHYQEITELRSENVVLNAKIDTLIQEKARLDQAYGEDLDEPRGL